MSVAPAQSRWFSRQARRLRASPGYDVMLVAGLGMLLLVRVLTDDAAASNSRQSGSLDLSGTIAGLLVLLAVGLLARHRRGALPAILATLWLCVWTAIAIVTSGASGETLREGVREGSVVALAVIVCNAPSAITVARAARITQIVGVIPGVIAVYQMASHTGMDISGALRANGTFAHPDSAAMFFAIAAVACLWLYLDNGRALPDMLCAALFAAGVIATLSIDGLVALLGMLVAYAALRPGPARAKLAPCAAAALVLVAFVASPLGAHRIAREASTRLATVERGEASTSLDWRLDKWKLLLPEWEKSPLLGRGLGTTTTAKPIPGNRFAGRPPHNEYVRYLVETGVIGLAILLWALAMLVRRLQRRRGTAGVADMGVLNATTLALVVIAGCLVNALADNTLLNSPTCYIAALIVIPALSSAPTAAPYDPTHAARAASRRLQLRPRAPVA